MLEKGMQESAQAAMSYIRSREKLLGLDEDFYQKIRHPHALPRVRAEGRPVRGHHDGDQHRQRADARSPCGSNVAMTGEITLRGRVMPIGGLKEKLLAAHRAGIDTLAHPKENRKDLREIPRRVLEPMRVVLVEHMDQVLREALCLSDPDAIFGKRIAPMEYLHGKLITHGQPTPTDDDDLSNEEDVPAPTVDAPSAQQ